MARQLRTLIILTLISRGEYADPIAKRRQQRIAEVDAEFKRQERFFASLRRLHKTHD